MGEACCNAQTMATLLTLGREAMLMWGIHEMEQLRGRNDS